MLIPDNETAVDYLNHEAIAGTIVELLKDNRKRALTIGVHGDWGAGKSSILKMIETGLSGEEDVACLWFNGWAFQGFDDAKTVLIESIINELCRQRGAVGKVKELGSQLIRKVNWLKLVKRGSGLAFNLVTGLPSPDQLESLLSGLKSVAESAKDMSAEEIEAKLGEAGSFFKATEVASVPEVIHDFREDFKKLLAEAKIDQLVVLIDDLDRCLPSTAIDTLEAIRLFLFVPKTAFVIGADEAMIEYAVREHFPDLPVASGPMSYSRNYLEKLVQVPFRIPALGIRETRTYVTLLLVQGLVEEQHKGFQGLLAKAKESMNQPWLGTGLDQSDVRAVQEDLKSELDSTFVLAQQIGPILAEGTKGNPRQIIRFLNALLVRQAIARARQFGERINQAVLAKLMLAERFQPDFYDFIASRAMVSPDGKVAGLAELESESAGDTEAAESSEDKTKTAEDSPVVSEMEKWRERIWLQGWGKIEPALADVDLRPYVFVARDKRIISVAPELGGLEGLIEKLCGSEMAVRSIEPEVKALIDSDAAQVFDLLRERVLRRGTFTSQPPGFDGLGIVAKHHVRFQTDLISLLGSIEAKELGIWVIAGWNEILTETSAREQLRTVMTQWAGQDENQVLKKAAGMALPGLQTRAS